MIFYETDKLILRNYLVKDVDDYFEYMSLVSTAKHEDFEPYSLEECEKAVTDRLHNDSFWVVELKQASKVIGDICYRRGEYETYEI